LGYAERKLIISSAQRKILEFFEGRVGESLLYDTLIKEFNIYGESELFYRLEHLRMLGFIECIVKKPREEIVRKYRLTAQYLVQFQKLLDGIDHYYYVRGYWDQKERSTDDNTI